MWLQKCHWTEKQITEHYVWHSNFLIRRLYNNFRQFKCYVTRNYIVFNCLTPYMQMPESFPNDRSPILCLLHLRAMREILIYGVKNKQCMYFHAAHLQAVLDFNSCFLCAVITSLKVKVDLPCCCEAPTAGRHGALKVIPTYIRPLESLL